MGFRQRLVGKSSPTGDVGQGGQPAQLGLGGGRDGNEGNGLVQGVDLGQLGLERGGNIVSNREH